MTMGEDTVAAENKRNEDSTTTNEQTTEDGAELVSFIVKCDFEALILLIVTTVPSWYFNFSRCVILGLILLMVFEFNCCVILGLILLMDSV